MSDQRGASEAAWRRFAGSLQVVALWVLTWPAAELAARPGLDASFRWGLQQAFVEGRAFGTEVNFTYGPLGFLSFPTLYFTRPTFLSLAARSAVMLAGCGFVLWAVRRVLAKGPLAFLAAYVLVSLTLSLLVEFVAETLAALFVGASLAVLLRGPLRQRERSAVLVAMGATVAVLALMKANTGMTAAVLGLLVAVSLAPGPVPSRPRATDLGAFLGSGVLVFLAGWLLAGQALGDLVPYARASRELADGYSSAMALEIPTSRWNLLPALLVLVGGATGVAIAARDSARLHGRPPIRAVVPLAVFALAAFAQFKHGFVRHDTHAFVFFAALPLFLVGSLRRPVATLLAGAAAVAVVAAAATVNLDPVLALSPREHLAHLREQADVLRSASKREELRAESRVQLVASYGLDATTVGLLAGRRAHVDPWESQVLFAHPRSVWAPVPVFQSYSAYTAALDRRNAEVMAGAAGPEVVLREVLAIDGRSPAFESPAYMLAMACNFTEAHAQARWFVLTRSPDRCGPPVVVAEVEATAGEGVRLPAPSACPGILTVAVEGLMAGVPEKLLDLLYKGNEYYLDVPGGSYRFLPLTGTEPHLLWAPGDPAWLGAVPGLRQGGEIAVRAVASVELFDDVGDRDALRYTFECVPVQARAAAGGSSG